MKRKKIIAFVLAATMVAGSSMTAFAANNEGGATGTGELIPHLDKDVITVTLPTDAAVTNVFDFTVDPEALIKDAAKLTDGTAVTGNEDGVYFKNTGTAAVNGSVAYSIGGKTTGYTVTVTDLTTNATYIYDANSDDQWENSDGTAATVTITITDDDDDGATVDPAEGDTVTVSGATAASGATYSSSSDAVEFKGQNSVNVDVTVVAEVEASASDANDIILVADETALDAATAPALLMTLKAGTDEKVITTEAGATAKAMIAGAPDNFEVDAENGNFVYKVKADADETKWKSATVQLAGRTNKVSVPTGDDALTAPKVKLTWTVTKSTAPAGPTLSNATANTADTGIDFNATFTKGTALTCTFDGLDEGVTVKSATWGKTADAITSTSANITTSGNSFTIAAGMWGTAQNNELRYIKITTSDNKEIVVKLTVKA